MSFRFSLAAVLRMRQIAEEREEKTLTDILREIVRTTEALERIDQQVARLRAMREDALGARISSTDLQSSYGRVRELEEARAQFQEQLRGFERLRDQQIRIYESAHGSRQLLTDMRNSQRNVYDTDLARQSQKTLDDLFLARRKRR